MFDNRVLRLCPWLGTGEEEVLWGVDRDIPWLVFIRGNKCPLMIALAGSLGWMVLLSFNGFLTHVTELGFKFQLNVF